MLDKDTEKREDEYMSQETTTEETTMQKTYAANGVTYTEVHYEGTEREEVVTRYANGVTYVEHCTFHGGCEQNAVEEVTPYSLCAEHATKERNDRALRATFYESPEFKEMMVEEAKAEHAYELRAAFGKGVKVTNILTGERFVS